MASTGESVIVACPQCGQKNRVPLGREGPMCGRCGAALPEPQRRSAAGTAPSSGAPGAGRPVDVTDATFATEVLGSPLPVLLDCWAAWCGPCRAVAPSIERLAAEYAGLVKVCKLDVDANPRTAAALGVQGIPALFFLVGGRAVDRLVGAHLYETIRARLEQVIARAAD